MELVRLLLCPGLIPYGFRSVPPLSLACFRKLKTESIGCMVVVALFQLPPCVATSQQLKCRKTQNHSLHLIPERAGSCCWARCLMKSLKAFTSLLLLMAVQLEAWGLRGKSL